jgi:phosphate-selective porin OprO and OprP
VLWANATPGIPDQNYFEFRRVRFVADGTGYGQYDFRLQIDIEPENGDGVITPVTDVKDAYFTLNDVALVQRWRIGNFFVPFSLEQVTNDTNNIFMERSIPTQGIFSADREVGMATYGVSDTKNTTWTFGVFFDRISESLKERIDDNQGARVSGRFTHLLYYDEPSNGRYLVHTGAGVLHTENFDDRSRFRARPQIHEGPFLIDSGNIPSESYTVGNIELATVWGPFSVQSELFATNVNLLNGGDASLYGYYVYGSYFLTGENRIYERYGQHGAQFARNVPYTNFFLVPGCFGTGGWEAKVRTSYLDLEQVGRGQYQDITAGFNWYWSDRVRVMFDWIHPFTTAETVYGTTQSDILAMRFDFNW